MNVACSSLGGRSWKAEGKESKHGERAREDENDHARKQTKPPMRRSRRTMIIFDQIGDMSGGMRATVAE